MTLKTRNKAMLYVLSKRQEGVFKVGENEFCYHCKYEDPHLSGVYYDRTWIKPNKEIEQEIEEVLTILQWQGRGDHWRGKLFN